LGARTDGREDVGREQTREGNRILGGKEEERKGEGAEKREGVVTECTC